MKDRDSLIARLRRDERRNISFLGFIAEYPVLAFTQVGNSVLASGRSDRKWWYVSSDSEKELDQLAISLPEDDRHFAVIEDWMIPILARGKAIAWDLAMMRFVLPDEISIPQPQVNMTPLALNDAEHIYENSDYRDFISPEYVRDRIRRGVSACIRQAERPVAWAMTQDDGAIGFLHVLPEFRNHGYGAELVGALGLMLRERSRIPFAYVKEENQPAIRLMNRLGFVADRTVHWIEFQ